MSNIKVWYKLDGGAGFVFLEPGSTVEGLRHAVKIAKEAILHGVGHDDLIVHDPSGARTAPFTLMKDDPQHLTIYVVKIPPRATLGQYNASAATSDPTTPTDRGINSSSSSYSFPHSPPRNGIWRAAVKLDRSRFVSFITSNANPIVIIRSPPATGKTSLLDLTEAFLKRSPNTKIVRFPVSGNNDNLLSRLELEVSHKLTPQVLNALDRHTWILIDDAQLAFENEAFWKVVIKDIETANSTHIHVVIAATYDLMSQGSTPCVFTNYAHVGDLRLTATEASSLYDGYVGKLEFVNDWTGFKDTLLRLSNGHVGVLTGGIAMLHRAYSNSQKILTQEEALTALRGSEFRLDLARCFPCKTLMSDGQREAVAGTILNGPSGGKIGTTNGMDPAEQLVRSGILSNDGTFSCLVAQWLYFNIFYARPTTRPESIESLILQSVKSMSALRLRQSCDPDTFNFPKEAAFQQLFNEAMTLLLPPAIVVCPELNTFARNGQGDVVTGELDFFINGELGWAIELLRLGHKIGEHMQRFDPVNGKYRSVAFMDHLVVDCRGPRTFNEVKPAAERCTLYFAADFGTVEVVMRLDEVATLELNN